MIKPEIEDIVEEAFDEIVTYGDKTFHITVKPFNEVDADRILRIDLSNLVGELVTFPVIVNQFGVILAKVEQELSKEKLTFEIFEANSKKRIRENAENEVTEMGKPRKITVDEIENIFISMEEYKKKQLKIIELQQKRDIVNSLFWTSKNKLDTLNKLSLTITREQLENIPYAVINNIEILTRKAMNKK